MMKFPRLISILLLGLCVLGNELPAEGQETPRPKKEIAQNPDEGKFATSEDGVLFYAPFDNVLQANKANGAQECSANGQINFHKAGVLYKAVRLREGEKLSYRQKHNVNLDKGTVAFWMRAVDWDPSKQTKSYNWLFSIAPSGAEGGHIQIFKMPSPLLMGYVGNHGKVKQITHDMKNWKQDQWYFLALTWEAGKTALYLNGKLLAKVPLAKEELPRNTGDEIRLQSSCGTTDFDELTIYDHALTGGEIENLYMANLPGDKSQSATYRPALEIGRCAASPKMDGTPDEKAWAESAALGGFLEIPELEVTDLKTAVRATYDDKAVYFLLESALEPGNYPKPSTVDLKTLWLVPSAEILFQAGTDPKLPVYQLAFNLYGQQLSFTNSRPSDWKAEIATSILPDKWIAEVRIPYEALGLKAPGKGNVWRFNVGRNFLQPKKYSNPALSLAYGDVSDYWDLTFADKASDTFEVSIDRKSNSLKVCPLTQTGTAKEIRVYLKKLPLDLKNMPVQLKKPLATQGMVLSDTTLPADRLKEFPLPGAGRYLALLESKDANGRVLFRQMFQFKLHDSFHIRPVFFSKQKRMEVVWELNQPVSSGFVLEARILDDRNQVVESRRENVPAGKNSGAIPFDMSGWDKLHYRISAKLTLNGKSEERSLPFQCFYNAEWNGFEKKMNLNRKVLPPWVPIRVSGNTLETLTQKYTLSPDGFPEAVSAIGKALTAAPVSLAFSTGKSEFKAVSPIRWLKKTASLVVWQVDYQAADCRAVLTGQLEFDGMIRYDLTLKPLKDNVRLDTMILTVPFRREIGKYMLPYAGPYQKWSVLDIPTEINGHYADAFMPHLWAGDDTAGLAWFAESDEFYFPKSRDEVVEITETARETDMRINMVQVPFPLKKELTYTFGLQATPARRQPENWTSSHLASCISTKRTPLLTMGYTTGSEYHQYSGVPYPTKDDERARRYVQSTNSVPGRYALIYATSNGMGGSCPEFIFFEEEWKNPLNCDTWTLASRGEYHWGTNPNSQSLRDFYLWTCQKTLEKFGNDGFYYDFATVVGVDNPASGCGYERDGKRYRTWPIFADRAMRRAIYEMVMDKRGHAMFVYHNYSQTIAPITSFATMILDGEPYQQRTGVIGVKITSDFTKLIPLSRLKTMFGVQFGTVPCLLVKFPNEAVPTPEIRKATRTVTALALPHGVPVWGFYCDIQELNRSVAFQDAFGIGDAQFIPYYLNRGEIAAEPAVPEKILLSYWKKNNGETLVVLSNLTDAPYSGRMVFKADSPRKIRIMGDPNEISLKKGEALNVTVPPKDYQLYRIAPDGK